MGLVGQLASLRIERASGYTQEELDDRNRQVEWERGQIDYMGIDSFSNIQVLVWATSSFSGLHWRCGILILVSHSHQVDHDSVGKNEFDSLHSVRSNLGPLCENCRLLNKQPLISVHEPHLIQAPPPLPRPGR